MCHARREGWAPGEQDTARRYRPTTDDGSTRVSQAERDAVVSQLSKHTADGRLTLAEFEVRVEEAYAATTRADLDHALRELPREREHAPRRPHRNRQGWRPPAVLVIVAVVALAMATTWWAMWLLWPGLAWAGGGCGSGRYRQSTSARHRADDVIRV
jgi:Domain of unknown function (DUF1707)